MNIQSEIKKVQKQIDTEQNRFEKRKRILKNKLCNLYEKKSELKIGDKVKVASVTVRDIHRNSDIEILGKEGIVTEITGWITVKLDGCSNGHSFPDTHCLQKINSSK